MKPNPELIDYVERHILPQYARFDKAHREDHARMVMEQSLKIAEKMPEAHPDMVYAVAAFHDLGLVNGRENHHTDSRKILLADTFLQSHFSPEELNLMADAVEDHRASNQQKPRNLYGLIVAEADRFIDPETIIRRTVQYGLANYPELDREGHYQRTLSHLREKYGPNGYLK
ncbi:MAG: HD domain-containing protein, partial [Bacteroidales bacterium]|nr:HD domain-containing protein [Bacteroidales bacterium]